jgi:hypothetical protein
MVLKHHETKDMKKNSYYLLFILLCCQCGYYSFSGSTLPSDMKTIAIPVFEDRTSEFGVKESITDYLIQEYTKDNTLKIADPRSADSILEGTITSIRDEAGAYDASEQVKDIKVYVSIDVKFRELKKQKILWEGQLSQWGTYEPGSANGRKGGIDEAVKKLVTEIVNKTIAGW